MATAHSTHDLGNAGCQPFRPSLVNTLQNEKISCSFGDLFVVNPVDLLGHHVIVEEYLPARLGLTGEVLHYGGFVVGVTFGVVSLGTLSQLIIRPDGCSDDVPTRFSHLTVTSIDWQDITPKHATSES